MPTRDEPPAPPSEPAAAESPYLRKLMEAYGDYLGQAVAAMNELADRPDLQEHYNRQRVLFYSAEALRNFARDRTPPRTFDSLQDDVFHGVIDTCDASHPSALERLRAVISTAGGLSVSGNALDTVTRVADKQGICHQLANDDRLKWTKSHE